MASQQLICLLQSARSGDEKALEELLARLHHAIHAFLARRIGGSLAARELIPDAAQAALLNIVESLHTCHAETDSALVSWALSIGRNCAFDMLRSELPRYASLTLLENITGHVPTASSREFSPEAARVLALLNRSLETLTEPQQQLIWLRYAEDATWQEIGEELRTTRDGAKRRWQRLSRALERKLLHDLEELPEDLRQQLERWLGTSGKRRLGLSERGL